MLLNPLATRSGGRIEAPSQNRKESTTMLHHRSRSTWAALIAFLVGELVAHAAHAADPAPGVAIHGGVADSPNKVVYLSDPTAGVVAVDIDTGKLLWESKEAARPVAALGKRVYALAPVKGQTN